VPKFKALIEKYYIRANSEEKSDYDIYIKIKGNWFKKNLIEITERDIKELVLLSSTILSSITYNDNVIEKYLSSSVLDSAEENFNIFEIVGSDNFLEFANDDNKQDEKNDPDYIN